MNFNQAPYFDDFDEQDKFYRVLFRPGVAVQTREVNQLQAILQNQITKVGDHLFKEGSMVIPGQVNYNDKLKYLKISATNLGALSLSDLEDKIISDNTAGTGLRARVIKAIPATSTDPITLVLLYVGGNESSGGTTGREFAATSTLYTTDDTTKTLTVQGGSGISGRSVAAGIQSGVYYIAGTFVTVDSAVLSVKTFADTLSDINARIGIKYTESIITPDDDSSLYDNAAGTSNFAAPGAHRYKIATEFVQVGLDESPENFFELLRVEEGVLQSIVNASQYNILQETLARRTYEESGNYVVDDFSFDLRESRNNIRGSYSFSTYDVNDVILGSGGRSFVCIQGGTGGATEPAEFASTTIDESSLITSNSTVWRYTSNPIGNRGLSTTGSSSNLVGTFGLGKAYVQGFEISKITNSNVTIPKARDTQSLNNYSIATPQGNYVYLDRRFVAGIPDISAGPQVLLFDRIIGNRNINRFGYGQQVGTARINWTEPDARGGIRVGLTDIKMNPDRGFDRDVNSLIVPDATTSNVTTTSYTLTGTIKYAGGSTSSFLVVGGTVNFATQAASSTLSITGTLTALLQEVAVGDLICFGTSSHATTTTWTVIAVPNQTTLTVSGGALSAVAGTSLFVRFAQQTVFGHATGAAVSSRFQSEFRPGDTVWLGVPGITTTGTVLRIINENRMLVSSAQQRLIANTSIGTYYAGRSATFAGDVWGNYQLGINARKLTGLYQLLDYSGTTTVAQAHSALRIQGSNDAKLLTELTVNDLVDINGMRLFITKISSNTVAFGVNLDLATVSGTTTQFPAFRINNNINETSSNTLLFPVATAVSSITDNIFTVYKTQQVSGLLGLSSVTVTLAAASGNAAAEALATTDQNAFFVSQDNIATLSGPMTVNSVTVSGTNVIINLPTTFSSNTARVIYPVQRASASGTVLGRLRSKILRFNATDDFLGTSVATQTRLQLTRTDIYRTVKVYMATSFVAAWNTTVQSLATDVTSRYYLDNGQRDCFYDVGALLLKPGLPSPSGSIRVVYDFFEHGSGDFFARASYDNAFVPYETIPNYKTFNLADVLDFRTTIQSSGSLNSAAPPRFGTGFTADISYFLGRAERIYLDRNGQFYNVSGVSDLNPVFADSAENNNSINLYNLTLRPYTKSSEFPDVSTGKIENRRYTMRDIGKIENRVTQLEEVTSLSLLEQKTKSLQVRDNLDSTLERFKTGFFVDNFSDASNADTKLDARFSIDTARGTINASLESNRFPLIEKINFTPAITTTSELVNARVSRATENYKITGDLLTLDYTTATIIQQTLATTSIAVAPFLTATFIGNLRIQPDSDIYENVSTVNKIIGSGNATTGGSRTVEEAVAAYRRTGDWRPFTIEQVGVDVLQSTTRTAEFIPFCRPNTILMIGTGLKPNTRFYPYFDDLPVSQYVTGAVKFTFSALPLINFTDTRPQNKSETPRWRSLFVSANIQEVIRERLVGRSWVYDYGTFRRTLNPKSFERNLPGANNRDAYRVALGAGTSVWYKEVIGGVETVVGTGVAVYQEINLDGQTGSALYIVNARGKLSPTFIRAQTSPYNFGQGTFYISVENNDPKYVSSSLTSAQILTDDINGNIYTNSRGTVCALFDLPETDTIKFLSGKKPVVLTDDANNHPDDWTSKAEALYTVQGFNVTITNNYISTKTFVARPYDPIAQSFKLPSQFENGAFISDVDFFFQTKPTVEQAPIMLEIRTCDSTGRPSATEILPGTDVIKYPDDINVSNNGQTVTKFTFRQPVYLLPEKNYALVLRTDTKNYKVWIATLGQPDVFTPSSSYTTQALFGSFFKSQDGTLWTEDQLSDMKFRLNRCVFTTVDTGARVHVVNHNTENVQLPTNPLTFIHGSNKIRVSHKNHGFASGDTTRLYSTSFAAAWANNNSFTLNGIPIGEIFGRYTSSDVTTFQPLAADPKLTVSNVTLDNYEIQTSSVANLGATATTGLTSTTAGGTDIFGQSNTHYQVIKPNANILNFQPTTLSMTGYLLNGFTYDAAPPTIPYTYRSKSLNINNFNILENSQIILTDVNEFDRVSALTITAGGVTDTWKDSFVGVINMSTTTNHVSPAIDMSTFYIDTTQYRVDNPNVLNRIPTPFPAVGTTSLVELITVIASSNTTISFDGGNNFINTISDGLFNNVVPGRYITVSGSSVLGNTFTSTGLLVTSVTPNGRTIAVSGTLVSAPAGDSIFIYQYDDYTEEVTFTEASGESKFIIRQINLRNPASQIKMIVEACVPSAADFDVYYKTGAQGADFNSIVWRRFIAPNQPSQTSSYTNVIKSDVRGVFTDFEFNISNFDSLGNPVEITPFTAFQVKIVIRTSNAARVPQFRNLRIIAHA